MAGPDEFEQIYARYFNDVFLFLKQLSRNEAVAEEITSETFFKAMGSIDGFRGGCDIRVWLCQIAKNCYLSYLKRQKRTAEIENLEELNFPDERPSLEERMLNEAGAMEIHQLLHELKEPYKEVFMLRVFGELSFKQIAGIFQKTENWACVTYHRAKSKIIEQMGESNDKL